MARKNDFDYFDKFVELSEYCCKAANMLEDILDNYNANDLKKKMKEMHAIEHEADLQGHEITRKLAHEFMTPIEREDIISLVHEIDDITDNIEDVLSHVYMYNILEVKEEAIKFCKIIVKSCEALRDTLKEFKNFRKSKEIHKGIIIVNRLEEDGDNLYIEAMRKLHTSSNDAVELLRWTIAYNRLEKCCDACEDAVNVVESIIMKNS